MLPRSDSLPGTDGSERRGGRTNNRLQSEPLPCHHAQSDVTGGASGRNRRPAGQATGTVPSGACLVRCLYGFPAWTRTTRLIREHQALQAVLGAAPAFTPSVPVHPEAPRWRRVILEACLARITTRAQRPPRRVRTERRDRLDRPRRMRERPESPLQGRPGTAELERHGRELGQPLSGLDQEQRRLLRVQAPARRLSSCSPPAPRPVCRSRGKHGQPAARIWPSRRRSISSTPSV